ncbi:MAG: M81 family metallopeptidase [Acutalibacteraceae bacterium]|nr:M81 family metallopeptidase [Acutalibacteraceae bacterium]
MKIAVGAMLCEGNSLTPVLTKFTDFDYAEGDKMLEKIAVTEMLKLRGCDIVPTIYAHALPGGAVIKSDFLRLANSIVDKLTPDLDGVWLYLHGAMCVEELGSAEEALLKMVRDKIGYDIPVSVAMDFHADNSDEIPRLANCVTGYRTAPHCDREETERRAMELLFYMIDNKILPRPQIARANVIICGDAVQTALSPMKDIMEAAAELEKLPGMLSVQVFNGQPWIDEEYTGPNFVVTHESDETLANECAEKLAKMFYDKRHDFEFLVEAVEPKEALLRADSAKESTVFVSDSGDNTTAGAAGDNAYMLNLMQKLGLKNALLAGIMDADACDACYKAKIGDTLTLTVGGSLSEKSEKATITGKLIHRGDILSYQYNNAGPSATLDCGDITVVITKNRAALCRPDIFESINLDYNKFHVVVVKLGYLFPELAAEAERAILAFTPGASTERLQDMGLTKIRRPMFPLDDNFI